MKLIKVGVSLSLQGCEITDEIEVEDDATEAEIDHATREWAFEYIDYWHE